MPSMHDVIFIVGFADIVGRDAAAESLGCARALFSPFPFFARALSLTLSLSLSFFLCH